MMHKRILLVLFSVVFFTRLNSAAKLPPAEPVASSNSEEGLDGSLDERSAAADFDIALQDSPVTNKWPAEDLKLGQVAGVDIDSRGNVHVFHRGSRVWDGSSFNEETNRFRLASEGAIKSRPVWSWTNVRGA
jgi:hypothetical protein